MFSATQLSWLSVEQAWAITEEQWAELDRGQRLALIQAQYEGDILQEGRGELCKPLATWHPAVYDVLTIGRIITRCELDQLVSLLSDSHCSPIYQQQFSGN